MTFTKNGFLQDFYSWNLDIATKVAKEENINLTKEHMEVIYFLRDFFKEHNKSPAVRLLVKSLRNKYGKEKGNSLYLQTLFPESPAVQSCKIAGLPKPKNCI